MIMNFYGQKLPPDEIPEVGGMGVLVSKPQLADDPVLDHRMASAHFRDQSILVEMSPGV